MRIVNRPRAAFALAELDHLTDPGTEAYHHASYSLVLKLSDRLPSNFTVDWLFRGSALGIDMRRGPNMRHATMILLPLFLLAGCGDEREASLPKPRPRQTTKVGLSKVAEPSLPEARRGFVVKPVQRLPAEKAAPEPPPNVFR